MHRKLLHAGEKASKDQTRHHNRRLVLQAISARGETSRAVVARVTNLTPPTVSSIVRDLSDEGLIEERGRAEAASVGKPPQLLGIASGRYQIACLDLTGPCFTGAIIDLDGTVIDTVVRDEPDLVGDDAVTATLELAADLIGRMQAPQRRVSVATPGVVHPAGIVRRVAFFGWTDLDLGGQLHRCCGVPSHVINDSHALALVEFARLAEPVENLIAVRVARGVSAGIILNRAPYHGDGYGAGEIGFLLPSATAASIAHSSPLTIARLATRLGATTTKDSWDLDAAASTATETRLAQVAAATGNDLGRALAALVGALDIHTIRIDPALRCLGSPLIEAAKQTLTTTVVDSIAEQIDIRYGLGGHDAIIQGAAMSVTHQDLGLV